MTVDLNNKTVHALWIGKSLASLELLTISSFIANGHKFYLWLYDEMETPLPEGVIVRDANDIMPRVKIFRYRYKDQYGHGKGSLAGFSDVFRYRLLYLHGGWWVDMDVTCLKPLDFEDPYVFRPHHDLNVVGNVMKCPPRSELMNYCYERAVKEVDENNRDWHLPIQILNDGIKRFGLSGYIREFTNADRFFELRRMIIKNPPIPEEWYAIHWVNEEWRRNRISKHYSAENSTLRNLFQRYGIAVRELSPSSKRANYIRARFLLASFLYPPHLVRFIWHRFFSHFVQSFLFHWKKLRKRS